MCPRRPRCRRPRFAALRGAGSVAFAIAAARSGEASADAPRPAVVAEDDEADARALEIARVD
ncbi:MAG TPA: hypothetical protein VG755_26980, partial [Nannocystaceae bacterium]|nr:hypothetical protein [Nannocystaceae bacterium]